MFNFKYPIRLFFHSFCYLIPHIGGWFTKDKSPYRHLNQSIEKFPSGEQFLEWMRQTDWKDVIAIDLFMGLVTLYRGDKS